MEKARTPLWLIPNVLSLDAPLVALAWMWMYAKATRVEYIEPATWWVLPIAVWCVYALDRLIDGWRRPELREHSPRHRMHWRFRWIFLTVAVMAAAFCLYETLFILPRAIFSAGLVAMMISLIYFIVAYFRRSEIPYLKNFIAGMVFAMGVGIPINAANSNLLVTDFNDVIYALQNTGILNALWNFGIMTITTLYVVFIGSKEVWVFGLLCMMNITAIDLWEKASHAHDQEIAYHNESTLTLGLIFLAGGSLLFAAMQADEYAKPFFYSIMVSAAILQGVNHYRAKLSMNAMRALADVALLLPLPIFLVT